MTQTPLLSLVDELHERASRLTGGLTDFGPDDYMPGLRKVLECADGMPTLTFAGRETAKGLVQNALISRLFSQDGLRQRPECLNNPIASPLVIVGWPRSGTTALNKLLCADPQLQGLEHWVSLHPQPRPPRESWAADPWYQGTRERLDMFYKALPEMRAIHDKQPNEVDECQLLMRQDFRSPAFSATLHLPGYNDWLYQQDLQPVYQRYANHLKLIGANQPQKRWNLKCTIHLLGLQPLLNTFPDACIVFNHRDPAKAVPSFARALQMLRLIHEGDSADPHETAMAVIDLMKAFLARYKQVRTAGSTRFYDLPYQEFIRDPVRAVGQIYRHFDIPLSEDSEQALTRWSTGHRQGRHGAHHYAAEDFGLTDDEIRDHFGDYIREYDIPVGV